MPGGVWWSPFFHERSGEKKEVAPVNLQINDIVCGDMRALHAGATPFIPFRGNACIFCHCHRDRDHSGQS